MYLTSKIDNESDFEYMLRLLQAKRRKELKLNWDELAELIGNNQSGEYIRKLAYGIYAYDDYLTNNQIVKVANRILCISDTHVPFNLPVETFSKYAGKIDTLVLNGDIFDMQAISKFTKNYRVSPIEEIIKGRSYIVKLINYLNPKRVVAIDGNHEIRFGNYLSKNLDSTVLELLPNSPLELVIKDGFSWYNKREMTKTKYDALESIYENIEFVYDANWNNQIGDTVFCHPFTFSSAPLSTAKKSYTWFLEQGYDFKNIVVAHTHRTGNYIIAGHNIYESGCCADISANNYTDGKLVTSQSCGYLYLEQDKNGNTINIKQEII